MSTVIASNDLATSISINGLNVVTLVAATNTVHIRWDLVEQSQEPMALILKAARQYGRSEK